MLLTNQTTQDFWFGPLRLTGGIGQTLTVDDTSETSLYLTDDGVANAVHSAYYAGLITVSGQADTFPRATDGPAILFNDEDPNGTVFAPQGSVYLRRDATDGSSSLYFKTTVCALNTGWTVVGPPPPPPGPEFVQLDFDNETQGVGSQGGKLSVVTTTQAGQSNSGINFVDKNEGIGGSGDPVTVQLLLDAITQGIQILQSGGGSDPHPTGGLDVDVLGSITLISEEQSITILANASGKTVDIEADHNINLYCQGGPILIQGTGPSAVNDIRMAGLPTSNPGGSGKLWNNGGAVHIT